MKWLLLCLLLVAVPAFAAERLVQCTYPTWATDRGGSHITYPCSAAPCVYDDTDKRVGSYWDAVFCPTQWCLFWFVDTATSNWTAVPSPYCTMSVP